MAGLFSVFSFFEKIIQSYYESFICFELHVKVITPVSLQVPLWNCKTSDRPLGMHNFFLSEFTAGASFTLTLLLNISKNMGCQTWKEKKNAFVLTSVLMMFWYLWSFGSHWLDYWVQSASGESFPWIHNCIEHFLSRRERCSYTMCLHFTGW